MKTLHSLAGLLSATSILARRVAFPLLFLGAGLVLVQPCAGAPGAFSNTGSLASPRVDHTETLLPNGKVLVAGGAVGFGTPGASAELYDPASGTSSATGSLTIPRYFHTATLLPDGNVLVAGGDTTSPSFASAELYDPASGTWTATGNLATPTDRFSHTATLLPDGKVLVAGGYAGNGTTLASAELYDPASGTWAATGSLATARNGQTATLLPNGKVLVAAGNAAGPNANDTPLASAELYDPASGTWTATGSLATARDVHTATLLPNGKVVVAGGFNGSFALASAERYDPASGTWTATGSLGAARRLHTATLLTDGKVLGAGGFGGGTTLVSAELYDPASGTWSATGSLNTARRRHTAALLSNGMVLIAGGLDINDATTASAELYDPPTPATLLNISTRMRVLTGDQVLIAGFIITGNAPKKVIIRGIGPSLNGVGVTLSDPTLELHHGSTTLATNDNWKINDQTGQSQQAEIEATTIPPKNDLESAIVMTLSPGAYTAILAGKNGGTGVGLVEVYDLDQAANSQLANISTRGFVDTGNNVMIGGLIVGGGGGTARVIARALGPSVPAAGVLSDPTLELHNGSGTTIATNDNWKINDQTGQSQQAEIEATTIPPKNDLESALVATLAPGNYTAIVRGKNNTSGVGLVEVYNLQ
jgi:hypothetical protein